MVRADLDQMIAWRPFADPLYKPFDFPKRSKADHIRWFEGRRRDASRRMYVIENERRQVIGSLTLREIDGQGSARLGITIAADFVSQGYGTEALALFLDHYFGEMGFARMVLDVAATNLRAVRTYLSLGFRQVGHHYRPASDESYALIRDDPRYHHLLRFFRRVGAGHQIIFYDMILTREEWQARPRQKTEQASA
jgi:RimJ/RimL family protein N-acetyltransferase